MMWKIIIFALLFMSLFSCSFLPEKQKEKADTIKNEDTLSGKIIDEKTDFIVFEKESEIERKMKNAGLVDIQQIDSTILIEVKYATTDNFMGIVLYEGYNKVYLQLEVAERLSKAQTALKEKDTSLTLMVFDGARPVSVQQQMWNALDSLPIKERVKFVSNPANGSLHNFGCAVDLTIVNKHTKIPLDMGAGYDDLRKIAYPRHEQKFLQSGELSAKQIENRQLLRDVMRIGGFWVIETEWWHFNAFSRDKARELFEIIE